MNFEDEELFEESSVFDKYDEDIFQEAKLSTEDRDKLPSSEFGIPEERAFPLHDENHIRAAVSMFPHAAEKYKEGLAQRILVKAKKLGMDTSGWDSLNQYVKECDMLTAEQYVSFCDYVSDYMETYIPDNIFNDDYFDETVKPYDDYLKKHKYDEKTNTIEIDGKRRDAGKKGSKKERNRMNKFLRDNDYDPKTETIKTWVDDGKGGKRRVEFKITPGVEGLTQEYGYDEFCELYAFLEGATTLDDELFEEGFFDAGFGNLRSKIANYLGDKFTVSHVKKPMSSVEMFDIKNNENTDTVVKVEGTGSGVKITAKTGFEVERYGNNVPLSNAFRKLITVLDSIFPGQVVTESTTDETYERTPTGTFATATKFEADCYMSTDTFELARRDTPAAVKQDGRYWFPIDEMIAPLIRLCNLKGYQTSDCCFGHTGASKFIIDDKLTDAYQHANSGTYVGFAELHEFKNLPRGWHLSTYRDGTRTSLSYFNKSFDSDPWKVLEFYADAIKAVMDLYKYFEKLPSLSGNEQIQSSAPTSESYAFGDRSIVNFRYLMEAVSKDEDEDDDEDLDENNIEQLDDDDDAVEVSVQRTTRFAIPKDSDQQNDYDPKDVERLNKLIAAESDAINDYFDATKDSNDETLRRLYGDIGHEERFHLEQLLYAKSTLTGEKYEPRDPEVKKEYEELLAMGMDEDTAMSTAFDKHSMAQENDDEDSGDELDKEQEDAEVLEYTVSNFIASEELLENIQTVKVPSLQKSVDTFLEAYMIQEGIDNVSTKAPASATEHNVIKNNPGPIKMLVNGFKALIRFIRKLLRNVKITSRKLLIKQKRIHQFIKNNGISGIFADGVSLYFYNDRNCTYMDAALQYVDLCDRLTKIIATNVNMRNEWQNVNALPANVNPITFGNFDNGINILRGVILSKTKVVVTQDNKGKLAELFFGYTTNPANTQSGQSDNIMFKIQRISEVTANYLDNVEKFMGKLQSAHDDPSNAGRMNHFNEAIKSMSIIKKSIQKFINALTYDNNAIIKLDNGILNGTKQKDNARAQQPTQQQQTT